MRVAVKEVSSVCTEVTAGKGDVCLIGLADFSGRTIDNLRRENEALRALLKSHGIEPDSGTTSDPAEESRPLASGSSDTVAPYTPPTGDVPVYDPQSGETTHYGWSSFVPLLPDRSKHGFGTSLPSHVLKSSTLPANLHLQLLELFFTYCNGIFACVDRERFLCDSQHGGPEYSLFVHLCILATGAHLSDCPELRSDPTNSATAGVALVFEAWQLLPSELVQPKVSTVVGLCLLSSLAAQLGGGEGLGWIIVGIAIRLTCHLGLHSPGPTKRDHRDRAFWSAYNSDK